ncbi:MAG: LPS-assembly protein LptD, partial [Candidatus Saccharicenans sp.]
MLASGEVELHFGDLTLLADQLQLNTSTYEVMAEGNVTIQFPSEIVVCQRLIYNLRTKEGQLQQVQALARPSLLFGAQQIIRSADNQYDLKKAWLTTCTQSVPRWSFLFSRASLRPEDYVSMTQAVFRIKKLPLLYVPYLRYPLKDRATGFLFPQIGYNRMKGLSVSQSFYWSIARNMDATLSADFYSEKGFGAGLEYRYLFSGGSRGEASAYVFLFKKDSEGRRPEPAYILRLNHQQNFFYGFKLTAQVDYSSSFNFLREFENNFSTATVNNRSYQLNLSRSWAHFNFNLRSSRFETYFPQTGQSITSAYLPQFSFNLLKYQLWTSTYLSFDSGLSNWQYNWKSQATEGSYQLGNAYFRPTLSFPLRPADWLNLTINAGGNLVCYFQSYESGTSNRLSRPLLTSQARLGFNLEGPFFYRIYFKQQEPYLKHLLVPFVSYLFDSPLSEETLSRIISPFGVFRNNDLRFGLTQHFL